MFLIAEVEDKIKTAPDQFGRDAAEVLKEQIEIKYANRVLLHVGLCITFYDFISIGDPYLYPSEGSAIQIVRFRMVVFRPFVGEIITGRLVSSGREGLKISTEFFEDILIPAALLQAPCVYNPVDGLWTWKYGEPENDFLMDIGEEVRFKVRTLTFTQLSSSVKGLTATTTSETGNDAGASASSSAGGPGPALRRRSSSMGLSPDDEIPAVMQIIGAMNDFGLGLISWW
eukprot:gene19957-22684_t